MKILRIIFFIYRVLLSPLIQSLFGIQCRFEESCSRYAERMIAEQGFMTGLKLGFFRVLSCNPWTKSTAKEVKKHG